MSEGVSLGLRLVDGLELDDRFRRALRPGETAVDAAGQQRTLPRWFYEIESWEQALETRLTQQFGLWELIDVDVREADVMRTFPRYVPTGITILAAHLQVLRQAVGTVVRIAANGGYRSPAHALERAATPHAWAAAAEIYRIGSDFMDSRDRIEKYSQAVREALPGVRTRSYGDQRGYAFDQVYVELGFVTADPVMGGTDDS